MALCPPDTADILSDLTGELAEHADTCHMRTSHTNNLSQDDVQIKNYARILPRLYTVLAASSTQQAGPSKAAALIIGNEILSGSITDTNTPWLAQLLYK